MQEVIKENKDRKIDKIIEVYNSKLDEAGLEEEKFDMGTEEAKNKAKNLVA